MWALRHPRRSTSALMNLVALPSRNSVHLRHMEMSQARLLPFQYRDCQNLPDQTPVQESILYMLRQLRLILSQPPLRSSGFQDARRRTKAHCFLCLFAFPPLLQAAAVSQGIQRKVVVLESQYPPLAGHSRKVISTMKRQKTHLLCRPQHSPPLR